MTNIDTTNKIKKLALLLDLINKAILRFAPSARPFAGNNTNKNYTTTTTAYPSYGSLRYKLDLHDYNSNISDGELELELRSGINTMNNDKLVISRDLSITGLPKALISFCTMAIDKGYADETIYRGLYDFELTYNDMTEGDTSMDILLRCLERGVYSSGQVTYDDSVLKQVYNEVLVGFAYKLTESLRLWSAESMRPVVAKIKADLHFEEN